MRKKIKFYLILISFLSVVVSMTSEVVITYGIISKAAMKMLKDEAEIFDRAQDPAALTSASPVRVTIIGADGVVIADSHAKAEEMENHRERPEIRKAIDSGSGFFSRKSDTLSTDTLYYYYAFSRDDGSVLRVSTEVDSIHSLIADTLPYSVLLAIIFFASAVWFSGYLTNRTVNPMEDFFLKFNMRSEPVYPELAPVMLLIREKHGEIERKMNELAAQRRETEAIMEGMSEGMIFLDTLGKIILINPAAFKLMGESVRDCAGLDLIYFIRDKKLIKSVNRAVGGEEQSVDTKVNGRNISIHAAPVLYNGEQAGAICILRDITEQIKAENMRREFTANVSHELNTPLTSISGYSELLAAGKGNPSEFGERIHREAQHLISLISDILKLSELENGEGEHPVELCDLLEIARNALQRLEITAKERGITLRVTGEGFTLEAEKELLIQLVSNLCNNAVQYNKDGGSVTVTVEENMLSVSDTGIGIPQKDLERIFERFYRADKARSRETGGTGLGLAIVKHAAQKLGAKLSIESTEGVGTVVKAEFGS
ncbi:MAG: PAS domain S-box protein [Deferribacteraceae bacterium]|jgi:two-component system phosphate regulon sensor histidine kinase PhoR|nr:PAS domain S-box protein [Deferribacteraceae bacterium]